MEAPSILTAFIASFGLLSLYPSYYMPVNADTNIKNGGSETQMNFRDFFDSIKKNDVKEGERYRAVLEKEAGKEQLAFDTLKEQLRTPRQRHTGKNARSRDAKMNGEAPIVKRDTQTASNDGMEGLIPLGNNRYVNVHVYQGRILVDLREYYQNKEGKMGPGKRGIALVPEQWNELKKSVGKIDETLNQLLKTVPPQQGQGQGQTCAANQDLPF